MERADGDGPGFVQDAVAPDGLEGDAANWCLPGQPRGDRPGAQCGHARDQDVPVEYLSAEQEVRYGRFAGEPSPGELEQFSRLDSEALGGAGQAPPGTVSRARARRFRCCRIQCPATASGRWPARSSDRADLLCLRALRVPGDGVLDPLAVLEAAVTVSLDGGTVDEDVGCAVLGAMSP